MPLLLMLMLFSQTPASVPSSEAVPSTFAGTWELDPRASDDPGPLLDAFGVPKLLRRLAPEKPVQKLAVSEGTLTVTHDGPMGKRAETFSLDGNRPTRGELLGGAFEVVNSLENGTVVSRGSVQVNGRAERLVLRRTVEGAVMTVEVTVGELHVKRVFRRVKG